MVRKKQKCVDKSAFGCLEVVNIDCVSLTVNTCPFVFLTISTLQ
jgi:hypothetical protein